MPDVARQDAEVRVTAEHEFDLLRREPVDLRVQAVHPELENLGLELSDVWPGLPSDQWTLWNALLFPVSSIEDAWACARWMMRTANTFSADRWRNFPRLSLASSSQWADSTRIVAANSRRLQRNWQSTATQLALTGIDIRTLLAYAPGIAPLAEVGATLLQHAERSRSTEPTTAASRSFLASQFFGQAGLGQQAEEARKSAFGLVCDSIYVSDSPDTLYGRDCKFHSVTVRAPGRIDLGGGWSDTPPFCLDWGGTVLNIAVRLNGGYPITATVRRLPQFIIRLVSTDAGQSIDVTDCGAILLTPPPGDPFAIHKTALQLTGIFRRDADLPDLLKEMGGGLEVTSSVNLPLGSGLGTSSILAATLLKALSEMFGVVDTDQTLSDKVLKLEQIMTTGGGWQDQAGGIFPGAKLVLSGPGRRQRLRVQPVQMTIEREAELEGRMLLYFTGIRRIAKNLLQQIVGSYLARETHTIQVLHSIKTLAMEMAYALEHGEWDYLGQLLDRHWDLYQILDPNVTNAPINAILEKVRPYVAGAKLAGAGGGGFFMFLARSPQAAIELRKILAASAAATNGAIYEWQIAKEGLLVETTPLAVSARR